MPKYKIRAVITLAIGLLLFAICALFPPRQTLDGATPASRAFLYSSHINASTVNASGQGTGTPVEIATGRLLAECILILSLSGVVTLYFCLEHWQSKGETIWTG